MAQVLGDIAGAAMLYVIASGHAGFDVLPASPATATANIRRADIRLVAALVCEVVMTLAFLFVILGSTHGTRPGVLHLSPSACA